MNWLSKLLTIDCVFDRLIISALPVTYNCWVVWGHLGSPVVTTQIILQHLWFNSGQGPYCNLYKFSFTSCFLSICLSTVKKWQKDNLIKVSYCCHFLYTYNYQLSIRVESTRLIFVWCFTTVFYVKTVKKCGPKLILYRLYIQWIILKP